MIQELMVPLGGLIEWDVSELPKNAVHKDPDIEKINPLLHKTIKKVGEDIDNFKYNTAISGLMEFTNALSESNVRSKVSTDVWISLTNNYI